MFGDTEAYLEKYRTAARTRSIDFMELGPDFYKLEHTKPLFNSNEILTVHNLYNYQILLCVIQVLKFHTPLSKSIYSLHLNRLFITVVFCGMPLDDRLKAAKSMSLLPGTVA